MNLVGFQCKTPGCPARLTIQEIPEDTDRAIYFPISVGAPDPLELTCPDCKQAYDYYFSERQIRRLVHD